MKLGQNFFGKDQSIWGKPIIEYDRGKMDALLSEIKSMDDSGEQAVLSPRRAAGISMETELYLILHS
jgi:hypothetical protein